ncbi:snare associated Golgi protein-domain-containing protein [Radiomyces spectabilis]|uniref:snare associated Golgi protein-domain-containing protein n=1 Tax=Radiomyces spectabilis TaxID=64574 RepID=UPI00221E853C|nr:snare associated Golgi protein-domain-containing protein [Radiomyces spectabilis]KAI8384803.1 snare associated Golgi protein-domain-containing protein [Radiomyces spectabilis]
MGPDLTPKYDSNDESDHDDDECIYKGDQTIAPIGCKELLPRVTLFVVIGFISLLFSVTLAHQVLEINLPQTLDDVKAIARHLETMAASTWLDYASILGVFAVIYLWQQAFSIPGSVLLNLLAGHLYGIPFATVWTSALTAAGATLAYGLAMLVGEPFLGMPWVAKRAAPFTRQMERQKSKTDLFWWLLFARLFPFSPYWFINLISPLLGVPVGPFFWSTFLGSMPYNFICAQAGAVLGSLTSTSDILSFGLLLKLLFVSFISLVPIIWGKSIQRWVRRMLQLPPVDDDDIEKGLSMELSQNSDYQRVSQHD